MALDQGLDIKICGLSKPADIESAVRHDASMIGLMFFEKSPRNVTLEQASSLAKLARYLNPSIKVVSVTVNAELEKLADIAKAIQPDLMQLHGQETAQQMADIKSRLAIPLMKAIGVSNSDDLDAVYNYAAIADYLLLDAKAPKDSPLPGGNGLTFNWEILSALQAEKLLKKPLLLSGGLRPENVARAVQLCLSVPAITGLDVSSGVESSPGIKDAKLISDFLQQAQEAQKTNKTETRVSA
ncbi:MAG: phosphoribosylanthranilate isomerase [Rhizobiales bacterium]|nr:phosphoribosylanthranilate isomerase [Hyphomicrobiales bacterium]